MQRGLSDHGDTGHIQAGSKAGFESPQIAVALQGLQIHSGIVFDVSFGDADPGYARDFSEQRESDEQLGMNAANGQGVVTVFP